MATCLLLFAVAVNQVFTDINEFEQKSVAVDVELEAYLCFFRQRSIDGENCRWRCPLSKDCVLVLSEEGILLKLHKGKR